MPTFPPVAALRKSENGPQAATSPVVVVFAADEAYKEPLAIALLSLLESAASETRLHIFILDDGLTEAARQSLRELAAPFGHGLDFIAAAPSLTEGLKPHGGISSSAYLRLYIPDLLPAACPRALYLDCDVLVRKDLTPLWRTDLRGLPAAAVWDLLANSSPAFAFIKTQLDLHGSDPYFNSGVMLLDLELWRRERLGEQVLRYAALHPERLLLADQDALNVVLRQRWLPVPPIWNQQSGIHQVAPEDVPPEERRQWLEARDHPAVIHFTGSLPKPWSAAVPHHPARTLFQGYMERTQACWPPPGKRFGSRTGLRKIVSVSMVKNEEDVIEAFVRHHCRFLDGMVVLDNLSQDGTRSILRRLREEGLPLVVADDHETGFEQGRKITALARRVLDEEEPDLVLLLDADEFLMAADGQGDPRALLEALPADAQHLIPWRSYIPMPDDDPDEAYVPRRLRHVRPDEVEKLWKVMLPGTLARRSDWSIGNGNHTLGMLGDGPAPRENRVASLRLAHFPIRSAEQLQRKVCIGWLNLLSEWDRPPGEGFHWEELFQKLKAGQAFGPEELRAAALMYSLPGGAEAAGVSLLPVPESQLGGVRLRYAHLTGSPWIGRVLSHCESLALAHARQQRAFRCPQLELESLLRSRSWRLTAPLRAVGQWLRALRRRWRGEAT